MRVCINAVAATVGGGVVYLRELLTNLSAIDTENEYLIIRLEKQRFLDQRLGNNFRAMTIPGDLSGIRRAVWEQVNIPKITHLESSDVLLSPFDTSPLWATCPAVVVFHNPHPYVRVDHVGRSPGLAARDVILRRFGRVCAHRAHSVVFVSQWLRDAASLAFNLPEDKTAVVYHGISEEFRPYGPKWITSEPYLLFVSNIAKNKNVPFLVKVFVELRHRGFRNHTLLIAAEAWESAELKEVLALRRRYDLENRVQILMNRTREELAALYRGCDVFVFPSLAESFGIPPIEAMACGAPVVASDRTAVPEICASAALQFEPTNLNNAVETIASVLKSPDQRRRFREQGLRRARAFSWRQTAQQMLRVLENAHSGARTSVVPSKMLRVLR